MRRGGRAALRLVRRARRRLRALRQAHRRDRRERAAEARRARAPRAAPTASRACGGSTPTACARSSRTASASPRCTRRTRGSSTSRASRARTRATCEARGGELLLGHEVTGAERDGSGVVLDRLARDGCAPGSAIFCAGPWADRLAVRLGAPADPRIVPFRGAYLKLRPEARRLVKGLIYPVPDPELPFLGVHLTKHVSGEVWLGPSALLVGARDAYRLRRVRARDVADTLRWPGTWRVMRKWWRTGLGEIRLADEPPRVRRGVPHLRARADGRRPRGGDAPRASARRPSGATASSSTTSSSARSEARSTCATRPRRRPRRRSLWRPS